MGKHLRRHHPGPPPHKALKEDFFSSPPPPPANHRTLEKLVLLDKDHHPLIGIYDDKFNWVTKAVVQDGKTIGWLALRIANEPFEGLNAAYLEKQTRAIYWAGSIVLVIAVIFALLVTRWISKPINNLFLGTKAIVNRDYSVRVPVLSGDELGGPLLKMSDTLDKGKDSAYS